MCTRTTDDATGHVAVALPQTIVVPEDVRQTAQRLGIAEQLPEVIALAREVFGDSLSLRVTEDPELDDWTHILVEAEVKGTAAEVVAREEKWCGLMVHHELSHWFNLSTYYGE